MSNKIINSLKRMQRAVRYITMPLPISIIQRIRFRLKGFLPEHAVVYDFKNNSIDDYLNDIDRLKTFRINKYYFLVTMDKIISSEMLTPHVAVPKIFAYIHNGEIIPMDESWNTFRGKGRNIVNITSHHGEYFFKPVRSSRSYGIMKLIVNQEELFLNDEPVTIRELKNKINSLKHYIIQEGIKQDEFAAKLFPKSTNTMRLVTMVDPNNYETFMPWAMQRVGVNSSAPFDNFSAGGISFPIDMATGELGVGAKIVKHSVKRYTHHPETGYKITGREIPHWGRVKNSVIYLAKKFPYLKYLAWDVVVYNRDILIIEMNSTTDVNIIQIHYPILSDTRVRRYFEYHKIVRNHYT